MPISIGRAKAPGILAASGLIACGALLLAGCSSGSTTTAASGGASAGASGSAAFSKYTDCLKSHGVTLPSGRPSGGRPSGAPGGGRPSGAPSGGYGGGGGFGGGASADPSEAAAMQACASLRPTGQGGFGGGGAGASGSTQLTAFISCMKDNGVTVTTQQVRTVTSSTDAKTVAALKVCKPLLPTGS